MSESEAELDGPHNEVVLAQDLGSRGNIKSSKSAIRLVKRERNYEDEKG